jgi:hypothetical protein
MINIKQDKENNIKIVQDKSTISLIGNTTGVFQNSTKTWSDPTVTWSDAGNFWGGADTVTDISTAHLVIDNKS